MTVSSRKKATTKEEEKPNVPTTGIQYNCDFCHSDITHTVRIKCAAAGCEEVDLCPSCFCKGKEAGKHKRWHPYKVVEQHSYPIFTESWGADEELLLIEGLTLYGLGNWQDAAEHVGTRSRDECEEHYLEVWVGREREQPVAERTDLHFDIDAETFQSRKKRRIEDMRTKAIELPDPQKSKPLVSAPTNHEIGGFMPGRLDFEHEVYDEAETAVKDMEFGLVFRFGGDEQPAEGDGEGQVSSSIAAREDTGVGDRQAAAAAGGGSSRTNAVASGSGTSAMDLDDDDDSQPAAGASTGMSSRGLGSATAGKASGAAKSSASSKSTKQPPSAIPPHLRVDSTFASPSATPEPEDSEGSLAGSLFASPPPSQPSQAGKAPSSAADTSLPLPFSANDPLPFSDSPNSTAPLPFADSTPLPFASEAPPPPPPPPAAVPIPVNTDSPDYPEDEDDLELKLAVLEIYNDKLDRRKEAKNLLFQRGLMEHKKILAADRKRPQKEKDLIQKHKVFAKLQTAEDHEVFIEGLLYEQTLRTRITQLQTYRSKGITTATDAERYEAQLEFRTTGVVDPKGRGPGGRYSLGPSDQPLARGSREGSAGRSAYVASVGGRKPPAPLNLATAASLHLLSPAEQELCSTLRILPKPYLMIKETLIREYARRGGNLRRREARSLVKIDVNKTARIWDLMEEMGVFRTALDPKAGSGEEEGVKVGGGEMEGVMKEVGAAEVEERTGLRPVEELEQEFEVVGADSGEAETPRPPEEGEVVLGGMEMGMDGVVDLSPPPAVEVGGE